MLSLTVIASAISITGASLSLLSGLNSSCLGSSTLATSTFFLGITVGSALASCLMSELFFSDNPNFRGAWYGTNRLFLNAIFLGDRIYIP